VRGRRARERTTRRRRRRRGRRHRRRPHHRRRRSTDRSIDRSIDRSVGRALTDFDRFHVDSFEDDDRDDGATARDHRDGDDGDDGDDDDGDDDARDDGRRALSRRLFRQRGRVPMAEIRSKKHQRVETSAIVLSMHRARVSGEEEDGARGDERAMGGR